MDTAADPLLQQMSNVMRVTGASTAQHRAHTARRFSDSTSALGPAGVRGNDKSRLLPTPNEPAHRYESLVSATADSEPTPGSDTLPTATILPHSCVAAMCAVARVFETTELLELVLAQLETNDIRKLRRTSARWNAAIHASPGLRLHFFYHPEFGRPAEDFQLLPLSIPGLSIELGEPIYLGRWISVSLDLEAARQISPRTTPSRRVRSRSIHEGLRGGLGNRPGASSDNWPKPAAENSDSIRRESERKYKNLFITQPPILGMQGSITGPTGTPVSETLDDVSADDEAAGCAKVSCDAGVTLGFLAETAETLLVESRMQGISALKVVFKAIVSFTRAEPAPMKRGTARTVTKIG
ncbi:hypothetical protein LTR53_012935 [Teratosphaeriaceae sp. CCFEE 6253]|nr:hypothetical protein LTR53_012935 [Teratosphaeriaceae sp. CCFEE 6253]